MCGIFGRFAWQGPLGDIEELCASTNALAHRGPDDGAFWADDAFFMGHRRLSIIDLSPDGAQPMATPDGRFVIVFNGEIYNYTELAAELAEVGATFRSRSDTEVILRGYEKWGSELPQRLVGMFAFAIADRTNRSLFVARDRFGEKPLLLVETRDSVTFSSELGPLARLPENPRLLDQAALSDYLCLNYVPSNRTLLAGTRRLDPGTCRIYDRNGVRTSRYWSPPAEARSTRSSTLSAAASDLGARLDRSVRIALRADVPVALFLSGGIDSSVVAESAVRQGVLRHAYCLHFEESGFSELPNATRVAKTLGLELRPVVMSSKDLVDFSVLVQHGDDPLADSSALPVFTLARAAAKDYKVVISGDGGDELFGGYLTYRATRLHERWIAPLPDVVRSGLARLAGSMRPSDSKVANSYKVMRFLRAADLSPAEAHFSWNGAWLPRDALRLLANGSGERPLGFARSLPSLPDLADLQRADVAEYLPNDILTKVDRMTMAHGLESRAPLLVPEVAEFGLALPARFKAGAIGPSKRVLRHLVTARLGKHVGHAKKQGFSIPVHRWLRGPLRPTLESLIARGPLDALGALDTNAVLREKERHIAGEAQLGFELWGLMVLVEWHKLRIREARARRFPSELRRVWLPDVAAVAR